MNWISEQKFIFLFLILYTAILAYHAYQGKRKTHNLADYYVGGRSMGGAIIGLSFLRHTPVQTHLSAFPDRLICTVFPGYY